MKKKVLLIGPIPPPYGGVSVHISRFYNLLKNDFSFDFVDESPSIKREYFNIRSFNLIRYIKKIINSEIIYIHSGNNLLRIFHLIVGKIFFRKIILTLHGFTSTPPKYIFYINGLIYRLANIIVVVNEDIKKRLFLPEKKCILKEAFIPPLLNEEPELPKDIINLIHLSRKEEKIIICANAFRLEKYKNEDLYGLDLCLNVSKRLLQKKISFIFIFIVSTLDKNADMYLKNELLIKELHLQNHFFLINKKLSFSKLLERSDIIVRPTNTDGDSITIREGLFLNKKVLASDVVERPQGVNLFKNRDIDDLEKKLMGLIVNKNLNSSLSIKDQDKVNKEIKLFYHDLIESNV